jgi:hypothetical protein
MDGRLIYKQIQPFVGGSIEISTAGMEAGIYLLRCSSGTLLEVHRLMVIKP